MWQTINEQLYKKFEFSNFVEAFAFITKIAFESERANHHPTITITYNKVEIWLTTHDAGNKITQKDIELSSVIDKLR
jgi:4a-hydroxytetrahydrobiopterin dehydratase